MYSEPRASPGAFWRKDREQLEVSESWRQQAMAGYNAQLAALVRMPPKPDKGWNCQNEDYYGNDQ